MKKILAIAAAAALTAGVSAFAANPFSDVSTDDWAYQAVSDLSDQGVVEGYPDGTFKGERNITRYELAQIIARLMAKEDQLNAEQRATLDKLAGEYADELANLGVRVSNLEKKVGNIYWSGDARMRYINNDKINYKTGETKDTWDGRIALNIKGQVNDSTYAFGRLRTDMNFKEDTDKASDKTYAEQIYVNHNFGKDVAVRLGRQPISFGDQGGWLYNGAKGYDGAQVAYNNGKLNATVGYGQFNVADGDFAYDEEDLNKADMFFAKAGYDFDFAKLGVDYIAFQDKHDSFDNTKPEIWGVNLNVPVQQFNVFGDYYKNTTAPSEMKDDAWNAGLGYGKADWKKPGTWNLAVAYNEVGNGVYFGKQTSTSYQTSVMGYIPAGAKKLTFWNALANVTLQKNVQLRAEYSFDVDSHNDNLKDKDSWTVSLNYKF